MASISSSTVATASRTTVAQANMVAPFTGLKSNIAFPVTKKANNDLSTLPSNGGRVQCMKVWPPLGLKKYETLSYLPPLSEASLAKEVDYLLRNKWVPCLEFEVEINLVLMLQLVIIMFITDGAETFTTDEVDAGVLYNLVTTDHTKIEDTTDHCSYY